MRFEQIADELRLHPKLVGVEDYELVCQTVNGNGSEFENGALLARSTQTTCWTSLRVVNRKQPGASVAVIKGAADVDDLVDKAIFAAHCSSPDPWFRFPLWKSFSHDAICAQKPNSSALFKHCRVQGVVVRETLSDYSMQTHLARKLERRQLSCQAQTHSKRLRLTLTSSEHPVTVELIKAHPSGWESLDANFIAVFEQLAKAPAISQLSSGPVLVSAQAAATLIRFLSPRFLGNLFNETGDEPPIRFPPCVTIIDDGRHPLGAVSVPFDLEGVHTQRTLLVKQGQLVGRLCDTYQGARLNQLSTGNRFRRPTRAWPEISPTTLYLEKGGRSATELFRVLGQGTVIFTLREAAPSTSSAFSMRAVAMGWQVNSHGDLSPFSSLPLDINVLDAVQHVIEVCDDLEFFGAFGSPSILFEKIP